MKFFVAEMGRNGKNRVEMVGKGNNGLCIPLTYEFGTERVCLIRPVSEFVPTNAGRVPSYFNPKRVENSRPGVGIYYFTASIKSTGVFARIPAPEIRFSFSTFNQCSDDRPRGVDIRAENFGALDCGETRFSRQNCAADGTFEKT